MNRRRSARLATVTHFDWRDQGNQVLDPRIHFQEGNFCWALVAAELQAAANKLEKIRAGDINAELKKLSVQHIIDGCLNEVAEDNPEDVNPENPDRICECHWVDDALDYIRVNGILEEDDYRPFDGRTRQVMEMTEEQRARLIRGGGGVQMFPGNDNIDENEVMRMVQITPMYGTMQITYDFEHFRGSSIFGGMHTQKAKELEKLKEVPDYHSIIVTGFGKLNDGRTFWNIKNSWGTNWGDGGFAKVARPSSLRGRVQKDKNLIDDFGYALPPPPPPPVNDL